MEGKYKTKHLQNIMALFNSYAFPLHKTAFFHLHIILGLNDLSFFNAGLVMFHSQNYVIPIKYFSGIEY